MWKVLEDAVRETGYDPLETELRARTMLSRADVRSNCDSLHLVEHLLRFSSTMLESAWPPEGFVPSPKCPNPPSPLVYLRGVNEYKNNRLEEALVLFRQAAETAQREGVKELEYLSLQAVGAALTELSRFKEAVEVFLKAYDLVPESTNIISLNNLAYAHLLAGQCKKAISWANLALDRLELGNDGALENGNVNNLSRNVVLLTRLQAQQNVGDATACMLTFRAIDLKGEWNGREAAALATLTDYLQWQGDAERFSIIRPMLDRMASAMSPAELIEATGVNYRLFSPWSDEANWRAAWDELLTVPDVFRGGLGIPCASDPEDFIEVGSTFQAATKRTWGILTLGLLIILAGAYLAWHLRNRSAWRALRASPPDELRLALEGFLSEGQTRTRRNRFLALKSIEHLAGIEAAEAQQPTVDLEEWTSIEQDVAAGLAKGEHTKAIAQRLNISLSAVYKARHALRARFNLQAHESLERRLRDLFSVVLIAALSSFTATAAPQSMGHQEVVESIHADDYDQWLVAIEGLRANDPEGLPAPFDLALKPALERPAWAQVEDTLMWLFFKAGATALENELLLSPTDNLPSASPTPALQRLSNAISPVGSRLGPVLAVVLAVLCGCIFHFERRLRRLRILSDQRDWNTLAQCVQSERLEGARETWRVIKSRQPQLPLAEGFWNLLTRPEQTVAQLTAQDWSVQAIADHMSCSAGNVYNLRSSIRQKWSLDPTDDLARFIQSLQTEENEEA